MPHTGFITKVILLNLSLYHSLLSKNPSKILSSLRSRPLAHNAVSSTQPLERSFKTSATPHQQDEERIKIPPIEKTYKPYLY